MPIKKEKIIFFIFLFITIAPSLVSLTHASENKESIQDEAVFKYRDSFDQHKTHRPVLLKEILLMQLSHNDVMPRFNVAEVLGELGDPAILEMLWDVIIKEKTPMVREAAVEGMILTQNKLVVPYFLKLLDDQDVLIRRKAALGCGELADASIQKTLNHAFLREKDELNKITIAAAMAKLGDKGKEKLITNFLLKNTNPDFRYYVINLLHTLRITLDDKTLKKAIENEINLPVKVWMICLLAKEGDTVSLSYLKNILAQSNEAEIKSEAAKALTHLEEFEYVYPFLLALLKEKNWEIRESAIEDLNNFREYPLVPILGEVLLHDENSTVREIAAWALGERKDKAALPYLEKGLYDESADVRTGVIAALYKILTATEDMANKKSPSSQNYF